MTAAGLFGLDSTNIDLAAPESWGKNKFNNTFPVSLLCYSNSLGINPILLKLDNKAAGGTLVRREEISVTDVLGCPPKDAHFAFEEAFEPFRSIVDGELKSSDVVVKNRHSLQPCRALEIKLVVVPDNTTAKNPVNEQSCEIVARPLMVEMLALNLCRSFMGDSGRQELQKTLNAHLTQPNHWRWEQPNDIIGKLPQVMKALQAVLESDLARQCPMVLQPIWRTEGQAAKLEENCFDIFVWSDYAFAQLFLDSAMGNNQKKQKITRPQRSVIWLVKLLWDYATTGLTNPRKTTDDVSLNFQTDKAGSFAGTKTLPYLQGPQLTNPRIDRGAIKSIVLGEGLDHLSPERRFDAAIYFGSD